MKRAFRTVVFTLVLGCELLFKQKRENKEAKTNSIHLSVKQGTSHNGAIVLCNLKPSWIHPQPRWYRGKCQHFMFLKTADTFGDLCTIPVISRPDYVYMSWLSCPGGKGGVGGVTVRWDGRRAEDHCLRLRLNIWLAQNHGIFLIRRQEIYSRVRCSKTGYFRKLAVKKTEHCR